MTATSPAAPTLARRVHWTTANSLESLAFSRPEYVIEFGSDDDGDYGAVVTREGTEFRARLTAVAK